MEIREISLDERDKDKPFCTVKISWEGRDMMDTVNSWFGGGGGGVSCWVNFRWLTEP